MDEQRLSEVLVSTLADRRLSRSERVALGAVLSELITTPHEIEVARSRTFALAHERARCSDDRAVIDWIEDVLKVIQSCHPPRPESLHQVCFSPGPACVERIASLFDSCRQSAEVCVFTITDDRISSAILRAHERGVSVRIITDNAKSTDQGSDIDDLETAGIAVAVDDSAAHMHHKFAIFDDDIVATGSFNWTRSAADENQENLVVLDDTGVVRRFRTEFEALWRRFSH
jgi:cardiolipin hydrolase